MDRLKKIMANLGCLFGNHCWLVVEHPMSNPFGMRYGVCKHCDLRQVTGNDTNHWHTLAPHQFQDDHKIIDEALALEHTKSYPQGSTQT